jgi:hypothetical protein
LEDILSIALVLIQHRHRVAMLSPRPVGFLGVALVGFAVALVRSRSAPTTSSS